MFLCDAISISGGDCCEVPREPDRDGHRGTRVGRDGTDALRDQSQGTTHSVLCRRCLILTETLICAQALGSNALALAKRVAVPLMIIKPEAGRRIMIGASSKKAVTQVQTKEEPQEELEVTIAPRPNGGQPEKPAGVKALVAYEVGGDPTWPSKPGGFVLCVLPVLEASCHDRLFNCSICPICRRAPSATRWSGSARCCCGRIWTTSSSAERWARRPERRRLRGVRPRPRRAICRPQPR